MTREDIMHMAREAGVRMDYIFDSGTTRWILQPGLMRFAALDAALEAQEDEALLNEPVAMRYDGDGYGYLYIDSGSGSDWQRRHKDAEPLYTTPPKPDAKPEPVHIHTCGPDCQKPLCVNRRREIAAAVEAEREACAQVAEAWDADHPKTNYGLCIGNAIRARGSK